MAQPGITIANPHANVPQVPEMQGQVDLGNQELDCKMKSVLVLSILSMLLGAAGIAIGLAGGYFAVACLIMLLGSAFGVPAVLKRHACLMKAHAGVAMSVMIVGMIIGVVVAFVGAVGGAICDAYLGHVDWYYKCPGICSGTTWDSAGNTGYCPGNNCCTGMGASDNYCISQGDYDTCTMLNAAKNTFWLVVGGGVLGLVGGIIGCCTVCCANEFFTRGDMNWVTEEQLVQAVAIPMQPVAMVQANPVATVNYPQPNAPPGGVYMKNGVWLDADGAEVKA